MIKHIVMFKIKECSSCEDKQKVAEMLKNSLDALPSLIDEVKEFEVGIDILKKDASFDIVLIASFDNLEALQSYSIHPEHLNVVKLIKEYTNDRKVVDFEY